MRYAPHVVINLAWKQLGFLRAEIRSMIHIFYAHNFVEDKFIVEIAGYKWSLVLMGNQFYKLTPKWTEVNHDFLTKSVLALLGINLYRHV